MLSATSLVLLAAAAAALGMPQGGSAIFFPDDEFHDFKPPFVEPYHDEPEIAARSQQTTLPPVPEGLLEKCLADWEGIPFFDANETKWVCQPLGEQGPCPEKYWFVMDEKSTSNFPKGICRAWDCDSENSFLGRDRGGQCVERGKTELCPDGMMVVMDPLGFGVCDCIRGKIPYVEAGGTERRCYEEYLRGPCQEGEHLRQVESYVYAGQLDNQGPCEDGKQIVDVTYSSKLMEKHVLGSACLKHFCPGENQIRWETGVCVESPDPCPDHVLTHDRDNGGFSCDLSVRRILGFERTCPKGQEIGPNGKCTPVVDFSTRSNSNSRRTRRVAVWGNNSLRDFLEERFGPIKRS